VLRLLILCGLLALASTAAAGCATTAAGEGQASDPIVLWRDGPHLRGANLHQRRVVPEIDADFFGPGPVGPPVVQDDLDRLAAAGANLVVLSHPGLYAETAPYVLDTAMVENLDRLIRMAAEADLFVVIALRTGPGRSEFTFFPGQEDTWFPGRLVNNDLWTDTAAQSAWADMWRFVANRYRDAAVVVGYELMVEPNAAAVLGLEDDPEAFARRYGGTGYDWGVLYPRVVEAIREVDSATPLIVDAHGWSDPAWLSHLALHDDPRIVWAVHPYEPHDFTHQDLRRAMVPYPGEFDLDRDGEPEPLDAFALDRLVRPAIDSPHALDAPLAATEYGIRRWVPGAAAYIADLQAVFERSGMNSAIWQWMPLWAPTRELNAFDPFRGPQPDAPDEGASALGGVVRAHWALNEHRPSAFVDDPAAGVPGPIEPATPVSAGEPKRP
jgi:hypothetical protein